MHPVTRPGPESLLQRFLATTDPAEADRLLEAVIADYADRPIRDVIRRTLGPRFGPGTGIAGEDADDLRGEALVLLVRKLRNLKVEGSAEPITDVAAYAATIAYHACYAHLRRIRPRWTRLRNQIRYLMTHDRALSLTKVGDSWMCRPAVWNGAPAAESAAAPEEMRAVARQIGGMVDAQTVDLRDLVKRFLARIGRPVDLDTFTTVVAELRGIEEPAPTRDALVEDLPDQRVDAASALEDVAYLRRVWEEVWLLPVRQRVALLLNLRDARGASVLPLLPITGVASIRRIADALELAADELAALWTELPLEDLRIAERLGVTRQQVINLRKAARERLTRRMRR